MTRAADAGLGRGARYCSWHRGYSEGALLVQIIEQGSGPGAVLYACADCRTAHQLPPLTGGPS